MVAVTHFRLLGGLAFSHQAIAVTLGLAGLAFGVTEMIVAFVGYLVLRGAGTHFRRRG